MSNILKIAGAGVSAAAEETDANFNQTVLLLHGDGTNGAQNNTFLDSGTANSGSGFTITRNGNTTQGTFSPFSAPDGRWSNYFDGTGDYLTAGTTSDFNFMHNASALFTIEGWLYRNSGGAVQYIAQTGENGSANIGFNFYVNASNQLGLQIVRGVAASVVLNATSTGTIPVGAWCHFAVTYDQSLANTNCKFYIDGVAAGTGNKTANAPSASNSTDPFTVGFSGDGSFPYYFPGYISNLRVTNSIVYSAAFTPSTSPLTAITDTELLTCQSNRFVDNSSNAFAITTNGDVKVTPFSPFAPTAAYDASVNGGSGYFDGTGDYLSLANSTDFDFGSGAFCVECWVYQTEAAAVALFGSWDTAGAGSREYLFAIDGSQQLWFIYYDSGSTFRTAIQTGTILINQWNHLVVCRDGSNNWAGFVNGVRVAALVSSNTIRALSNAYRVGVTLNNTLPLTGYVSNLRVVKGDAVYDPTSTTLTVPTAPLTDISNTQLLCNFTNAGIFDNTGKNVLETVGSVQLDTATKVFGTASMEFDGTGDYLLSAGKPENNLNIGNFTLEFWVYLNNLTADQDPIGCGNTSTTGYQVRIKATTGYVQFLVVGGASITTTTGIAATTWTHVAIVRSGTTVTIYLNGVDAGGSGTVANSGVVTTEPLVIGLNRLLSVNPLNGFIDDLRITNGVARTITVPTKAYPDL